MPWAIVILDLKGYSTSLSEDGKRAVVKEFFPEVCRCLANHDATGQIGDVNTWGDSIVAAFRDTPVAANFALDVQELISNKVWGEKDLHKLGVRIALHVADLCTGVDPIRAMAKSSQHLYGGGMVLAARLEPRVNPNSIWMTEQARGPVQTAIDNGEVRGELHDIGEVELPKQAGKVRAFALTRVGAQPPAKDDHPRSHQITAEVTALQCLRLRTARALNEYVECFHIHSQSCRDVAELKESFRNYHANILSAMRLRIGTDSEVLDADVLEVDRNSGELRMNQSPTTIDNLVWLPTMKLCFATDGRWKQPKPREGVAPYCVWVNTNTARRGVLICDDVHASGDARFLYEDMSNKITRLLGWYQEEVVKDIYKPADSGGSPPYRSLLSAAVMLTTSADRDPRKTPRSRCLGVLNLTSTTPAAFGPEDASWAQLCASLIASLYQSYSASRDRIAASSKGKPASTAPRIQKQYSRGRSAVAAVKSRSGRRTSRSRAD